MEETILQLPCELSKYQSMSKGSIRLIFDSQEAIPPELKSSIIENHEKTGWLSFLVSKRQIRPEDVIKLEEIKEFKTQKTPSQVLYNRMFVYYKEKKKTSDGFDEWRRNELEKIGQQYLSKINN